MPLYYACCHSHNDVSSHIHVIRYCLHRRSRYSGNVLRFSETVVLEQHSRFCAIVSRFSKHMFKLRASSLLVHYRTVSYVITRCFFERFARSHVRADETRKFFSESSQPEVPCDESTVRLEERRSADFIDYNFIIFNTCACVFARVACASARAHSGALSVCT